MSAHIVDALVEWRVAALNSIGGHCAGHYYGGQQVFGTKHGSQSKRSRNLRPIQKRKTFFRRELNRVESCCLQCINSRHQTSVHTDLTFADERTGHVCEGCQIAGSPNRPARWNARIDVVVDHLAKQFDQLDSDTGKPFRQCDDFHQHDEPDDVIVEILANADGMRTHQVCLQLRQLIVTDADGRQLSEAGVHAVNRFATRDNVIDQFV